jgi:hypothetical protein
LDPRKESQTIVRFPEREKSPILEFPELLGSPVPIADPREVPPVLVLLPLTFPFTISRWAIVEPDAFTEVA